MGNQDMVEKGGLEPPIPEGDRFTVCCHNQLGYFSKKKDPPEG